MDYISTFGTSGVFDPFVMVLNNAPPINAMTIMPTTATTTKLRREARERSDNRPSASAGFTSREVFSVAFVCSVFTHVQKLI